MDIMPAIPRAFFLYGEPLLIIFGALRPYVTPRKITALLGLDRDLTPLELLLAGQNATNMLLIALVNQAIMIYGGKNPKLVHAYVAATAVVDIPYWMGILFALGKEKAFDAASWTPELQMEFLMPAATFTIKVGYLLGVFGQDRGVRQE